MIQYAALLQIILPTTRQVRELDESLQYLPGTQEALPDDESKVELRLVKMDERT